MRVLGIETSCDETGVALYETGRGLVAEQLYSQIALHAPYGGVVPELASRDHIRKLTPLIQATLADAKCSLADLDGIAYTAGPGLLGALLVGAGVARSLAYALNIPAVAVNHLEAHLLAPLLEENPPCFPFLALLVSGGHTQLVWVQDLGQYELLGETEDDAVGEAFDKVAKKLGLPYPGGPALAKLAAEGDPTRFYLPRPMTQKPGLDFSFSGLKTATLQLITAHHQAEQRAHIARAFEEAVVETLVIKCQRAIQTKAATQLVVAGGVAANQRLRQALKDFATRESISLCFPKPAYCTDNGAMVAFTGWHHLQKGNHNDLTLQVNPRWSLGEVRVRN